MDEPDHISSTRTVYDHSASLFVEAVGTEISDRTETASDRAYLEAFADDVHALGGGPALDVGCGPGRATAFLAERGLDIRGIDLSPAMVDAARLAHPELRFDVGSLTDLGADDASVAGVVFWYSIIHTPPDDLASVWTGLARVLAPGGRALVAFQTGSNQAVERPDAYGSSASLTRHTHSVDAVRAGLEAAGLIIDLADQRPPELPHEDSPQGFVTAHRPVG